MDKNEKGTDVEALAAERAASRDLGTDAFDKEPKTGEASATSPPSSTTTTIAGDGDGAESKRRSAARRVLDIVSYTPKHLRYDPDKPLRYSVWLNVLFALAGMSTVANLYYSHPILNILAEEFGVTDEQSSNIPTLAQAGYATGLLLVNPLGDFVKRRPFVLILMLTTSLMWIGLCLTRSFSAFVAITYLTSLTTVTPQIMMPLVADLAPAHRRATALSIVTSGLLLGLLFARLMSGVVTNYVSWRYVYWIALGLQLFFTALLWFCMPDYPRTNRGRLHYPRTLWSIVLLVVRNPVLVQAGLVGFFTAACFTSFWTTLTFLLAGPPYFYTPLVIGLFALIGVATMFVGPLFSRLVIDRCVPLVSAALGVLVGLVSIVIGTYTGTYTVAGPVVMAAGIDIGFQVSQISNRSAIYAIDPRARNRVNTAYMLAIFCGQLMGTAVGNHQYAAAGWVRSGQASIGFIAAALAVCFLRGPWETGWLGWRGGWSVWRRDLGGGGGGSGGPTAAAGADQGGSGSSGGQDEEKGRRVDESVEEDKGALDGGRSVPKG